MGGRGDRAGGGTKGGVEEAGRAQGRQDCSDEGGLGCGGGLAEGRGRGFRKFGSSKAGGDAFNSNDAGPIVFANPFYFRSPFHPLESSRGGGVGAPPYWV